MKILLLCLATLLATSVQASELLGTWHFPKPPNDSLTFDWSVTYAKDSLTVIMICTKQDHTLTATVTAHIKVDDKKYEILEEIGDVKADYQHDFDCNALTTLGPVQYELSNDGKSLTIHGEDGTFVGQR